MALLINRIDEEASTAANCRSCSAAIHARTSNEEAEAMNDGERFRKHAEECRPMASKVISPLDKEAWLKLAEDWLRLAQSAERREGSGDDRLARGEPQNISLSGISCRPIQNSTRSPLFPTSPHQPVQLRLYLPPPKDGAAN